MCRRAVAAVDWMGKLMISDLRSLSPPLFQRVQSANLARRDWANASAQCMNLCESHWRLGGLVHAAEAASNFLDHAGKIPDEHEFKNGPRRSLRKISDHVSDPPDGWRPPTNG